MHLKQKLHKLESFLSFFLQPHQLLRQDVKTDAPKGRVCSSGRGGQTQLAVSVWLSHSPRGVLQLPLAGHSGHASWADFVPPPRGLSAGSNRDFLRGGEEVE